MSKKINLENIFDDDPFGLLELKPISSLRSSEERLIESYKEINEFYKKYQRTPSLDGSVFEKRLHYRLNALLDDKEKSELLKQHDIYGLLVKEEPSVESIDDILNGDSLSLLRTDEDNIFNLKHVPKEISMPDEIARRKPCKDFGSYQAIFKNCQAEIAEGKRKLIPFRKEQEIDAGSFFVLKGVLLLVAEVGEKKVENNKMNARLHCIFENGTESNMLLRSLARELYRDGRRVTEHEYRMLNTIEDISDEDQENGYIYVLKSKSEHSTIKEIKNLYKIGFTKLEVSERIKNAEKEPTFLMAKVSIVETFKCYNVNPQKLEHLLHGFFGAACLNLDIYDEKGNRHVPREWFIAPLPVIEDAINFIINGDIIHYMYDIEKEIIVAK